MKTFKKKPLILSIQKKLFLFSLIIVFFSCNNESEDNIENKINIEIIQTFNQKYGAAVRKEQELIFKVKDELGNPISKRKFTIEVDEGSIIIHNSSRVQNSNSIEYETDYSGEFLTYWTPGTTVGTQIIKINIFDIDGNTLLKNSVTNIELNVKPGIGTFYNGGVIFYLDKTLDHGFMCPLSDQSFEAEWGCRGTSMDIEYRQSRFQIGDGFKNTQEIESICSTPGTAADLCANLTLNGYDDWFLPSQYELREMMKNYRFINETAIKNNGSSFKEPISGKTDEWYWSSTETSSLSGNAENINLSDADVYGHRDKNEKHNVRAIRAF